MLFKTGLKNLLRGIIKLREVIFVSEIDWDQIMIASEASLKLGMNKKYIYLLWKEDSNMLLENSVCKKGNMLLITRAGYEHLKPLVKKEEDLENK